MILCFNFTFYTLEFCFWCFSVITTWPSEGLLTSVLKLKCKTSYQVPWTPAVLYSQSFVSSFIGLQEGYLWLIVTFVKLYKSCMCYSMGALFYQEFMFCCRGKKYIGVGREKRVSVWVASWHYFLFYFAFLPSP